MTVGIIGAGIAGLTLGCLLKQRGVECEIFEQSDDVTKYGAGISLTSNAQFPLNNLNILEEIKDVGCEPLDIVWREPNGKVIRNMSLSDFGHVITINRKDLIKILINKYNNLGGIINYNYELSEIANTNQTVKFRNGEARDFKHIIACDGLRSATRTSYVTDENPTYSGYTAWRGIGTSDSKRINIYLGPGSHVVCYPVDNKLNTSFIGIAKRNIFSEETWKREGDHTEMMNDLGNYDQFLHSLFKSSPKVYKWGLYLRNPLKKYCFNNLTLLGDAAHPILPFLGQGGAMAIEDAYSFGSLLLNKNQDFEKTQKMFEKIRLNRVRNIDKASKYQGMINHLSNKMLVNTRNFMLKNTNIASRRTSNIYNYNITEEIKGI